MMNGILRPLANPEGLKNLPMCNFEKKHPWKRTPFQNSLETYPKYPPKYPMARALWSLGVGIWDIFPNNFEKVSVSRNSFVQNCT